ncbi:hypothetical protein AB205_0104630 [Aquarana catesbeiana]|uniref:V-SNARE coiled-coil homology domain-containing protein n=1 Tax=Aquarana catesbeiana TaxID=8400 RepID=A0A2G9S0C8_AQUCT|nr:hypothetical protein AB205_0104630 [Aquarana catesbeiana]
MRVNVDKVLERDQKLSELDDRADALQAGASQFETSAAKLKRKYWWKNLKMMIIMGVICAIILIIIIGELLSCCVSMFLVYVFLYIYICAACYLCCIQMADYTNLFFFSRFFLPMFPCCAHPILASTVRITHLVLHLGLVFYIYCWFSSHPSSCLFFTLFPYFLLLHFLLFFTLVTCPLLHHLVFFFIHMPCLLPLHLVVFSLSSLVLHYSTLSVLHPYSC